MRLSNLVPDVSNMSDDELREHVRGIRHNKFIVKPAAQKHKEKPQKQERKSARLNINKMLSGLSKEQIAALIQQLEGDAK